jgi:hypothetical protein
LTHNTVAAVPEEALVSLAVSDEIVFPIASTKALSVPTKTRKTKTSEQGDAQA